MKLSPPHTQANAPKKIALIYALSAEAAPLIQKLELKKKQNFGDSRFPFQYFEGDFKTAPPIQILVAVAGRCPQWKVEHVGTDAAVLNTYLTLSQFQPNLVINAGTAGGFKGQGAQISDVYLSTEAIRYHDRRIPLPGYEDYGVGHYPVFGSAPASSTLLRDMAMSCGLKQGIVSTGNSLDMTPTDLQMIQKNQGAVKEMEAAAMAWVSHSMGIPFFALKAVTDLVDTDRPTSEEFLENLEHASQALNEKTTLVLRFLSENSGRW